jgi:hypothetical protein
MLPRCELLRHCLRGASPAFRIEVAPHTTRRHRQVRCVVLAKQMYEVALDNNPGTARFHRAGNPLVDVNISANAAKRNAGAKAADRSACDRNGEVGLRMPVHHPACLTGAVPNSDDPSLGMIADYMDSLVTYGAAFYRNLFWEAGLVGQVLYLEAEEASIRSTGIGCYFDDPVHEVFGISSHDWQSFYHFTVGGPVEDKRLTTLPAYKLEDCRRSGPRP